MTDDDGTVHTLLGWCQSAPGTKPDTYHGLCRYEFTSAAGVPHRCTCPNHRENQEGGTCPT